MNEEFRVVGRRPMPAPAPAKKAAQIIELRIFYND